MKKKKWVVASLIILVGVFIIAYNIILSNKRNTVEKLISYLENAINNNNVEEILGLYPKYCRNEVSNWLNYESLTAFYNNVVKQNGKIKISIDYINDYNSESYSKEIQENIYNNNNLTLDIEEYQIIIIDVYNDAGSVQQELSLQAIKIDGIFYLYDFGLELLLLI